MQRLHQSEVGLYLHFNFLCSHSDSIVRGSIIAKEEFGTHAAKENEIYTLVPWNHSKAISSYVSK